MEKALRDSALRLNPQVRGQDLLVPIPRCAAFSLQPEIAFLVAWQQYVFEVHIADGQSLGREGGNNIFGRISNTYLKILRNGCNHPFSPVSPFLLAPIALQFSACPLSVSCTLQVFVPNPFLCHSQRSSIFQPLSLAPSHSFFWLLSVTLSSPFPALCLLVISMSWFTCALPRARVEMHDIFTRALCVCPVCVRVPDVRVEQVVADCSTQENLLCDVADVGLKNARVELFKLWRSRVTFLKILSIGHRYSCPNWTKSLLLAIHSALYRPSEFAAHLKTPVRCE